MDTVLDTHSDTHFDTHTDSHLDSDVDTDTTIAVGRRYDRLLFDLLSRCLSRRSFPLTCEHFLHRSHQHMHEAEQRLAEQCAHHTSGRANVVEYLGSMSRPTLVRSTLSWNLLSGIQQRSLLYIPLSTHDLWTTAFVRASDKLPHYRRLPVAPVGSWPNIQWERWHRDHKAVQPHRNWFHMLMSRNPYS